MITLYKKVTNAVDFKSREGEVLAFWKDNHIFEKSMGEREACPDCSSYVFYDGPPTANGKPHIGHVLTRAIKDIIPRYHTMKGQYVPRKAGWDTHGLPVEIEVEKTLGLDGKEQIEKYGIEPFIAKCKESVWKYKGMWEDFSDTVGFWADMDHPYITYENSYIESIWWSLKEIWNKGLLYKGFKIVPYCPRCGTPLSSHEVAQGYKDVKERSAIVRFKVKGEDAYILAWTTTPWTLPSNVALCVNPDESYVKVKSGDYTYYMAEALTGSVLGEDVAILEKYVGKDLEYKEYEPLWNFVTPDKKAWYVTCDSYVTLTDGTGVVHIAPAFGEDDANVGRKYDLPFVQLVNAAGEMTSETLWAGMFCKDADKEIIANLKSSGLLFAAPVYEHSYPHCWRCGTPLIYYARDTWFIRMTAVRDDLVKNNLTVNWYPESIGIGRFGDWLKNVQDWGISRNRYWGTPLNIWECECGHRHSIGSIAELRSFSPDCPEDIELHRPFIDKITFPCSVCGKEMKRVPEVIDCWYDSGAMPFAQHHYPFENKELFEKEFPADFISEAIDQTRGWFYSLMAISTLLFNRSPFKNVIVMGHVQDEHGQKMSKSKGNAVDPFDCLDRFGADAIRWYFYTNSAPWVPSRWIDKYVREVQAKFLGTLWNTYAFYVMYAEIDGFDPIKYQTKDPSVMDRWITSKQMSMIKAVDENLAAYKIPEACKVIESFTDDLSNWYVRRSRERFWATSLSQDKINAYRTLWNALIAVVKCSAPMIPFMSDSIYQNIVRTVDASAPLSVHLSLFPECDQKLIDTALEANMDAVLKIVTLGRACRNGSALKNRQPLSQIFIKLPEGTAALTDDFTDIIKEELNIKTVTFTDDTDKFISYSFKPQLKTVGPKYGKHLAEIKTALSEIDGIKAKSELDSIGVLVLPFASGEVRLYADDLLIDTKQTEGYFAETDGGVTVAIDTTLTDELVEEGFINEIISKIQTMRKKADFDVMDKIKVYVNGNDKIAELMDKHRNTIYEACLAKDIIIRQIDTEHQAEWDINTEKVTLGVKRERV
jgi:isoleucyl-tRNA synthetase